MSEEQKVVAMTGQVIQTVKDYQSIKLMAAAASKYTSLLNQTALAGQAFSDSIDKCVRSMRSDIGDGIRHSSVIIKDLMDKRMALASSYSESLINPCKELVDVYKGHAAQFDKEFRKEQTAMSSALVKAEKQTKKAKQVGQLQEKLQELTNTVRELKQIRHERLRDAVLLHRRKYCSLLELITSTLLNEQTLFNKGSELIGQEVPKLKAISQSADHIPKDVEEFVTLQERTFISIAQQEEDMMDDGGYGGFGKQSPNSFSTLPRKMSSFDEGGYNPPQHSQSLTNMPNKFGTFSAGSAPPMFGGNPSGGGAGGMSLPPAPPIPGGFGLPKAPPPPISGGFGMAKAPPPIPGGFGMARSPPSMGGFGMSNAAPPPPIPGGFGMVKSPPMIPPVMNNAHRVRALYDCVAEQEGDLSFSVGDIITITEEDDGSGWSQGDNNGQVGIFPSNYVEDL